ELLFLFTCRRMIGMRPAVNGRRHVRDIAQISRQRLARIGRYDGERNRYSEIRRQRTKLVQQRCRRYGIIIAQPKARSNAGGMPAIKLFEQGLPRHQVILYSSIDLSRADAAFNDRSLSTNSRAASDMLRRRKASASKL